MSNCWNGIVVKYDKNRKYPARKFLNSRGNVMTFSGSMIIKSIILRTGLSTRDIIDEPMVLCSNALQYYDYAAEDSNTIVKEYSPIHIFNLKNGTESKGIDPNGKDRVLLFELNNPYSFEVKDLDEIYFKICNLNTKKINVPFDVHIYYELY